MPQNFKLYCPGRGITHSEFKLPDAERVTLPKNSYCPSKFKFHHTAGWYSSKNQVVSFWEEERPQLSWESDILPKSNCVIPGKPWSPENLISFSWNYDIPQIKLHYPGRTMIPKSWAAASWEDGDPSLYPVELLPTRENGDWSNF